MKKSLLTICLGWICTMVVCAAVSPETRERLFQILRDGGVDVAGEVRQGDLIKVLDGTREPLRLVKLGAYDFQIRVEGEAVWVNGKEISGVNNGVTIDNRGGNFAFGNTGTVIQQQGPNNHAAVLDNRGSNNQAAVGNGNAQVSGTENGVSTGVFGSGKSIVWVSVLVAAGTAVAIALVKGFFRSKGRK
jgi:hypothetical protein